MLPILSFWESGESQKNTHSLTVRYYLSTDLVAFFIPTSNNTLFRKTALSETLEPSINISRNSSESASFLGFLELGLLIFWIIRVPKNPRNTFFFFTFIVFGIFALGPLLRIAGQPSPLVILPNYALQYLPGVSFMRAPNRFVLIMMLMLAILNTEALTFLIKKYRQRARAWAISGGLVLAGGILIAERVIFPLPLMPAQPSEFFVRLGLEEEDFLLLPLPIFNHAEYNFAQIFHQKKIIGGGVADIQVTRAQKSFIENEPVLQQFLCKDNFPLSREQTRAELQRLNVKYVVIYKDIATPCPFANEVFIEYFGWENAVFEDDEIWVYQVF
ncbi:MAG: hypothetical protein HYV34_03025 [Candidatus Kerfeldbacteria bacterium]|nr:hypothetical protein [Candidatus Kerfeldbacteria bacterium]